MRPRRERYGALERVRIFLDSAYWGSAETLADALALVDEGDEHTQPMAQELRQHATFAVEERGSVRPGERFLERERLSYAEARART